MPIRVLLADDHDLFLLGLRTLLERKSDFVVVGEAKTGRQAVEMAGKHRPDVVLMDIAMPEMNGIDASREISISGNPAKIIALSMNADELFIRQMVQAGASGYLLKNSVFEELIEAIEIVMDGGSFFSPKLGKIASPGLGIHGGASDAGPLSKNEKAMIEQLALGRLPWKPAEEDDEESAASGWDPGEEKTGRVDFSVLSEIGLSPREIDVLEYLPLGLTNTQIALALEIREVTVKKHLQNVGRKLDAQGKTEILYQALRRKEQLLK